MVYNQQNHSVNSIGITPEFLRVVKLISSGVKTTEPICKDHKSDLNQHGLLPLASSIGNTESSHALYVSKLQLLQSNIENEITLVLERALKENICLLFYKGFVLGPLLYKSPILRPFTDIDIIVNIKDKPKIDKILQELGFVNPYSKDSEFVRGQIVRRKRIIGGIILDLDLHFYVHGNFALRNLFSYEELLNKHQIVQRGNLSLTSLSNVHAFINCCIHFVQHLKKRDLIKLIWLYDISLFSKLLSHKERQETIEIANNKKIGELIKLALKECKQYFPIDDLFLKELSAIEFVSSVPNKIASDKTGTLGLYFLQLENIAGWKYKSLFLIETVFPEKLVLQAKFGTQQRSSYTKLWIYRLIEFLR